MGDSDKEETRGERFLRIIREKSVQRFISMRHRWRVPFLINVPEELPGEQRLYK